MNSKNIKFFRDARWYPESSSMTKLSLLHHVTLSPRVILTTKGRKILETPTWMYFLAKSQSFQKIVHIYNSHITNSFSKGWCSRFLITHLKICHNYSPINQTFTTFVADVADFSHDVKFWPNLGGGQKSLSKVLFLPFVSFSANAQNDTELLWFAFP